MVRECLERFGEDTLTMKDTAGKATATAQG